MKLTDSYAVHYGVLIHQKSAPRRQTFQATDFYIIIGLCKLNITLPYFQDEQVTVSCPNAGPYSLHETCIC